mgnify:CR=1 FL=1
MDENIIRILASHGCKHMADDNKEMIEEIESYVKNREKQLHIPFVSGCFPTDKEIEEAADKELNNTYGTDWSDLEGIFINAVKWVKEYQANNR